MKIQLIFFFLVFKFAFLLAQTDYSPQIENHGPTITSNISNNQLGSNQSKSDNKSKNVDNTNLFNEINKLLAHKNWKKALDKLKIAQKSEPENISVINTIGNIYDKLYQSYLTAGEMVRADECFSNSTKSFYLSLTKEPQNIFANYSLGTLYYNKAASYFKLMQSVNDDMSSEGVKKYDLYEMSMLEMFDTALPFFEKVEKIDPKDKNSLIAIKEIYSRKRNLEKSEEYSLKLKNL